MRPALRAGCRLGLRPGSRRHREAEHRRQERHPATAVSLRIVRRACAATLGTPYPCDPNHPDALYLVWLAEHLANRGDYANAVEDVVRLHGLILQLADVQGGWANLR